MLRPLMIGRRKLAKIIVSPDALCIVILVALWGLYFWRLFTPNPINQLSLQEGDFSGQFVAYANYQADRLEHGQIALWDPFNNSGTPFLADTQAAALYPPRLITLTLVNWVSAGNPSPGVLYNALQLEMTAHVLLTSLLFYALLRKMTVGHAGTYAAGLAAALTFAYGGYLTGYPPLQLAILEAGVWLPLSLLGLHLAIRPAPKPISWGWLGLAGIALALAFLAGHPQTDLQFIYLCAGYLAYCVWRAGRDWRTFLAALIVFGAIGGGLAAAQVIPGLEFSRFSARNTDFSFDSQGNGFPLYDVVQMLFPGFMSVWSPLYFGITGAALALLAIWKKIGEWRFWLAAAAIGLVFAFGHNTILYDAAYNFLPGFSLFRGQERAAFVVAACCAVLVGLGASAFAEVLPPLRYQWTIRAVVIGMAVAASIFFVHWQLYPNDDVRRLGLIAASLWIGGLTIALLTWKVAGNWRWRQIALIGLIAFDLFTFGRSSQNYEAQSAFGRLPTPPLVQQIQSDQDGVYRVDGSRGLFENYGSLYDVIDINGTSPLRIAGYERLLGLPKPRAWELLAVRYVLTPDQQLPIPSTIVGTGTDKYGPINLHRLTDPGPFARLVYRTWIASTEDGQLSALADVNIDLRHTVVLASTPLISLPDSLPSDANVDIINVIDYAPEVFAIHTHTSSNAILAIAQVDYPGWQAPIDGQPTQVLQANLALMAVALPAGDHVVRFVFQPLSVAMGGLISLLTLALLIGGAMLLMIQRRQHP